MAEQQVSDDTTPDTGDGGPREIVVGKLTLTAKPVPDDLVVALDLAIARGRRDGSNAAYRTMLHQVILAALKRTLKPEDADAAVDQMLDGEIDAVGLATVLLDIKGPENREERRQAAKPAVRRGGSRGRGRGRR